MDKSINTTVITNFNLISAEELYEILRLRNEVFVVEQQCIYQDLDGLDKVSKILYLKDETNFITATCRIIPKGLRFSETCISRVCCAAKSRKKGYGKLIVQSAINYIVNDLHENKIRISAQLYLKKFYSDLGFVQTSEVYLEDGIEHIEMLYTMLSEGVKFQKCFSFVILHLCGIAQLFQPKTYF